MDRNIIRERVAQQVHIVNPFPYQVQQLIETIQNLGDNDYENVLNVLLPRTSLETTKSLDVSINVLRLMLELAVVMYNNTLVSLILNSENQDGTKKIDPNETDALELASVMNNASAACSLVKAGAIPPSIMEQTMRYICPLPQPGDLLDRGVCHAGDEDPIDLYDNSKVNDLIVFMPENSPGVAYCISRSSILAFWEAANSLKYGDCRGTAEDISVDPNNYCRRFRLLPQIDKYIFDSAIELIKTNPDVNVWIINKHKNPILMGRWFGLQDIDSENTSVFMLSPSSIDTYQQDIQGFTTIREEQGGLPLPPNERTPSRWFPILPDRKWIDEIPERFPRPQYPDIPHDIIELIYADRYNEALELIERDMPIEYYIEIANACLLAKFFTGLLQEEEEEDEYALFSPIIRLMIERNLSPNSIMYYSKIVNNALLLRRDYQIQESRVLQLIDILNESQDFDLWDIIVPSLYLLYDAVDPYGYAIMYNILYFPLTRNNYSYIIDDMLNTNPLPELDINFKRALNNLELPIVLFKEWMNEVYTIYMDNDEHAINYLDDILLFFEEHHDENPQTIDNVLDEIMIGDFLLSLTTNPKLMYNQAVMRQVIRRHGGD